MVVAIVLAGAMAVVFLLSGTGGPVDVTKAFLTGMAARDASSATFLSDPTALENTAHDLGLELLPASVTVSVADLQLRQTGDSTSEASQVLGTWTLVASGRNQTVTSVDQTATVDLSKTAAGQWRIDSVAVSGPLDLDLGAYFGSTGTSMADRDAALLDLQKGTTWLPGVTIQATDSTTPVEADPIVTDDPNAFITSETTTTAAVIGEITHWSISANDGLGSSSYEIASAKTTQEQPAHIVRGTLTEDSVLASAISWAGDWVSRVHHGDATAATQVTTPAAVTPAAWKRMQVSGLTLDENATAEIVAGDTVTVQYGGLSLVRQPGGAWLVDPTASNLMTDWLPGHGAFSVTQYAAFVDFTNCLGTKTGATLQIALDGIGFYPGGASPVATFRIAATGDLNCADGLALQDVTATWTGQATPVSLSSTDETTESPVSYIEVALPDGLVVKDAPFTLHVRIAEIKTFDWLRLTAGHGDFVARPE